MRSVSRSHCTSDVNAQIVVAEGGDRSRRNASRLNLVSGIRVLTAGADISKVKGELKSNLKPGNDAPFCIDDDKVVGQNTRDVKTKIMSFARSIPKSGFGA